MIELCGGVQAGLAHSGGANIKGFRENSVFWLQSVAGVLEGRPHDLTDVHG